MGVRGALRGVQSAVTALAEPRCSEGSRSGLEKIEKTPEAAVLSPQLPPLQPRREGVSPLAWPRHKGKDRVPCLGAQTWVGAWGEGVRRDHRQLPGPHPRASLPRPVPEVQPGPRARSPARPLWVSGPPGKAPPRCGRARRVLGPGCSRAPLDGASRRRQRGDKDAGAGTSPGLPAHDPSLHSARGTPRTALNDPHPGSQAAGGPGKRLPLLGIPQSAQPALQSGS